MKKFITILIAISFIITELYASPNSIGIANNAFIENKGQIVDQNMQINNSVLYLYQGNHLNVQLRRSGFSYDLWTRESSEVKDKPEGENASLLYHRIDLEFVEATREITITGLEKSEDHQNYYIGDKAITGIYSYKSIYYTNVWKGIDVLFKVNAKGPKYNFIIHPGANISDIKLRIQGATNITLEEEGLLLQTSIAQIFESLPHSYYNIGDRKNILVNARFKPLGNNEYGIAVAEQIPSNAEIVIDPVPDPIWANFYGGGNDDYIYELHTDNAGNFYMAGRTNSSNQIATSGAFQTTINGSYPSSDAFVVKFDPACNRLWATYFGGSQPDEIQQIAIQNDGQQLYACGITLSQDLFTTSGSHQRSSGGGWSDGFICKFASNGALQWSSYYGGNDRDEALSVAVDQANQVYISGNTHSDTGIATVGSHRDIADGSKAFLAKFSSAGKRVWATYHGGSENSTTSGMYIAGIVQDSIYVCGSTSASSGIGTPGTYRPNKFGSSNIYIAKFDTSGQKHWGTYYGGGANDYVYRGVCDQLGNIYVVGKTTTSSGIATPGAHQTIFGGKEDGIIVKFSNAGQLLWATYYGGTERDNSWDIALDPNGNLYVAGHSLSSSGIATPGTFEPANPTNQGRCTLVKFDSSGQRKWGTYLNLYPDMNPTTVWIDRNGEIYFASSSSGGVSLPPGVPTPYQSVYAGGSAEIFFLKFRECPSDFATASSNSPVMKGNTIELNASGGNTYNWNHPLGFSSSLQNPIINNAQSPDSGLYTVIVTDQSGCMDTVSTKVVVIPNDGVTDASSSQPLRLYPNPAKKSVTLDINSSSPLDLRITNSEGRLIKEVKGLKETTVIHLGDLPNGVYFYMISNMNIPLQQGKLLIE